MKKLLLFVAAVFCFATLKAQDATTVVADSTAKAKITFEKLAHDYGTINQGADGNCVFLFKNDGNAPLILSSVRASCGCTTPSWTRDPIMPGASGDIKVRYDTNRVGAFSKTITVNSNAENATLTLRISGTVNANQPITPAPTN